MTDSTPELSLELCRTRQLRFRDRMTEMGVDRAVLVGHGNIQYLTGFRPHRLIQAIICLEADGECILAAPNEPRAKHAADRVVTFEAQWLCTLRQQQRWQPGGEHRQLRATWEESAYRHASP